MTEEKLQRIRDTYIGQNLEKYEGGKLEEWVEKAEKANSAEDFSSVYSFTFTPVQFHGFYKAVNNS